jgi:hypothetical protein
MKHKIYYSNNEQLYKIESKRLLSKWETRKNYLYTDLIGNLIIVNGFITYDQAEDWLNDRYPKINSTNEIKKKKDIGFEF